MNSKALLYLALIFAGLGLIFIWQSITFSKFRFIACDVGQGDGMLIQKGNIQIVVDGGPGGRIVECLGQNMPFWDREIELVVNTHAQKDHLEGLVEVLARYKVKTIAQSGVGADSELFKVWSGSVSAEKSRVYFARAGDKIRFGEISLDVLWPTKDKADIWKLLTPPDSNETSVVLRLNYGGFCAYLTGDIPKETLAGLIDKKCEVLKLAHHGSKTGTDEAVIQKAEPKVAIIQVGKNNYGHPHKEVLELLGGIKTYRNDTDGMIELSVGKDNLLSVRNGQ